VEALKVVAAIEGELDERTKQHFVDLATERRPLAADQD
jgi:hypothetical protein